MFALGAVVIVRHFLPSAIQSRRPEEIVARFFFGELAGVFSNGWIDRDVVVYALNRESYRIRDVRLGGGYVPILYRVGGWRNSSTSACERNLCLPSNGVC